MKKNLLPLIWIVQKWTHWNKQYTNLNSWKRKCENWREIGLFAIQVSFINCKASESNPTNICICEEEKTFLFFLVFRLFNFSLLHNCQNVWNCFRIWNAWEGYKGRKEKTDNEKRKILSQLMTFEWTEKISRARKIFDLKRFYLWNRPNRKVDRKIKRVQSGAIRFLGTHKIPFQR